MLEQIKNASISGNHRRLPNSRISQLIQHCETHSRLPTNSRKAHGVNKSQGDLQEGETNSIRPARIEIAGASQIARTI
jgi:hypothetical protein